MIVYLFIYVFESVFLSCLQFSAAPSSAHQWPQFWKPLNQRLAKGKTKCITYAGWLALDKTLFIRREYFQLQAANILPLAIWLAPHKWKLAFKAAENLKGSIETIPALPVHNGSYPSEVWGGLKVDEIVLGGVQRAVPVAVVRVVVAHGEGRGLGEAAWGQLGRVVVGGRFARQRAVGVGRWETVGGAQLSSPHLAGAVLLHHHHLVGTERKPARGYCHQTAWSQYRRSQI